MYYFVSMKLTAPVLGGILNCFIKGSLRFLEAKSKNWKQIAKKKLYIIVYLHELNEAWDVITRFQMRRTLNIHFTVTVCSKAFSDVSDPSTDLFMIQV